MAGTNPTPAALRGFIASMVMIAVAYAAAFLPGGAPPWAAWLLAIGTCGSMVTIMAVGASRAGRRLGVLRWVFAGTFLLVAACFGLALALPAEAPAAALWLALPRRAAVLVYGIGLLPLFILPIAYAMTFERVTLSEADLADLRSKVAALRAAERAAGGAE